jgi:hypothetical protein
MWEIDDQGVDSSWQARVRPQTEPRIISVAPSQRAVSANRLEIDDAERPRRTTPSPRCGHGAASPRPPLNAYD